MEDLLLKPYKRFLSSAKKCVKIIVIFSLLNIIVHKNHDIKNYIFKNILIEKITGVPLTTCVNGNHLS